MTALPQPLFVAGSEAGLALIEGMGPSAVDDAYLTGSLGCSIETQYSRRRRTGVFVDAAASTPTSLTTNRTVWADQVGAKGKWHGRIISAASRCHRKRCGRVRSEHFIDCGMIELSWGDPHQFLSEPRCWQV